MFMIAPKLKRGDEVRVVAPARSISIVPKHVRDLAKERLEKELGLTVTFGKHIEEQDEFDSSSIESRLEDLHDAFRDKNVKVILSAEGGFNSNQLLDYLDYKLIKKNPKILCGYSDITAIAIAIYAKTGLVTYSGPIFSTFGMKMDVDYIIEYFKKCMFEKASFEIKETEFWSNDEWYEDQNTRIRVKNDGSLIINKGEAEGIILGGNLSTLNLLQGTKYFPKIKNSILFIEDDEESERQHFDRDLQSLIHQPGFNKVKAIVLGRFEESSNITRDVLIKIIKTKKELENIPVIADTDFGHTNIMFTFPIGGRAKISVGDKTAKIEILEH